MAYWQYRLFYCEACVARGLVTREPGEKLYSAWLLHLDRENELLGKYATAEAAQTVVERNVVLILGVKKCSC